MMKVASASLALWKRAFLLSRSCVIEDIKENEPQLIRMTTTTRWANWAKSGHSRKAGDDDSDKTNAQLAKLVETDLKDTGDGGFWKLLDNYISLTKEPYQILRMCDSDVPAMDQIYRRMSQCKATYESESFGRSEEEIQTIRDRFDARWDLMHNILHRVGFVLGPNNFDVNTWDGVTWKETREYIDTY